MKTTIDLPEDLVRGIKLRAIHGGMKMRDAAEEIIRRGLKEEIEVLPAAYVAHGIVT